MNYIQKKAEIKTFKRILMIKKGKNMNSPIPQNINVILSKLNVNFCLFSKITIGKSHII